MNASFPCRLRASVRRVPAGLGTIALVLALGAPAHAADGDCNRSCLSGLVTKYLNALVAHDPASLPVTDNVRFTEDTLDTKLGEGLWKTAASLTFYRKDVLDVAQSTAASHIIVEETTPDGTRPVMLVLRLKADGDRISEIETMVVHTRAEGILFDVDALLAEEPASPYEPRPSERDSRDELIRIAKFYPAGLIVGSFVEVDAPFAEGAYRTENGVHTAGPGCAREGCENIKTQNIITHPDLTTRLIAVDEEMGLVMLRMNFGDTGSYGDGNALIVWEAFKIYGGQIHSVEAFMEIMPVMAGSGWD